MSDGEWEIIEELNPEDWELAPENASNDINSYMDQFNEPQQSKFMDAVDLINKIGGNYLAPALGGAAQGLGSAGASLANLLPGVNIPHPDLREMFPEGTGTDIAFGVGNIGGQFLPGVKAAGLVGKLARPKGFKGLLADLLSGAGLGYALGENPEGEGRALSAALGGALNPLISIAHSEKLAERILKGGKLEKEKSSKLYNSIFNTAEKEGLNTLKKKIPDFGTKIIKEGAGNKYIKPIIKFEQTPTVQNAHKLQSDMGKLIRDLTKKENKSGLTSSEINALEEARLAQKKARGYIFESLSQKGDQTLANEYARATQEYAKNVIPYSRNKSIGKVKRNEMNISNLPKELRKNPEFMMAKGHEYPELMMRNILMHPASLGALGLGGIGTVGKPLYKLLMGE